MANVKISELTALTPPDAADLVPVTDSSASQTKRTTVGEIVGIVNGDVDVANDGTATISELPVSKLQDGDARQLLQTDAAGTGVEWTDDVDLPGTLDVTGATTLDDALNVAGLASLDGGINVDSAFTVANTSGNVATSGTLGVSGQSTLASAAVSDLTSGRVVLAGTSGELEDNAALTFNGTQLDVDGDIVITGNLTVEGATTTLETQTVTVEDKNIELGVVGTPTDTTADGGGITLKGATDKTINWVDATDSWTSSEHIDLASGKEFYIDGNGVLNATTLGSGVVNSSLTSVGTITTGTWEGTAIDAAYLDSTVVTTSDTGTVTSTMILDGTIVNADVNASAAIADTKLDTISTAGKVSNSATTATDANTASAIVARDASGDFSAGTITADLTGNADTATALETARDIGGVSFDGTININLPGVNTTGNQDTSGNAATATKLDSSRTFEVTGDVTGTVSSDLTSGASIATSIASGVIVDADVNAAAAIGLSKLATGALPTAITVASANIVDGTIVDADVNAAAAIAGTKIDPDFGSQTVETTGVFSAAGGAAATPSIAFTGDLNTGIYSPGADQLAISTSGTSRLHIASDGKVGIGITSASVNLHVNGSSGAILVTGTTNTAGVLLGVREDGQDVQLINNSSGGALRFYTNPSGGVQERARIDSSGRLLVGTSSQSGGSLLQVNDDRIRIASSKTPASASDTGTAGEICWDSSYIYVCTATNTWKRAALSTW